MTDKRRSGYAPVLFDDAAFAEDSRRASPGGAEIAKSARTRYERDGVPVGDLLACQAEGPEGTKLQDCMKVYLDRFGMVFRVERRQGRAVLVYAAFGVRHHPPESKAPTVYEIADKRLNF
jgi:hypothetical protein